MLTFGLDLEADMLLLSADQYECVFPTALFVFPTAKTKNETANYLIKFFLIANTL